MNASLPPVLTGTRRRLFARLLLWGGLQAVLALLAARLVQRGFDTLSGLAGARAEPALFELACGLLLAALFAGAARRLEIVDAEKLAQSWVQEVRNDLLRRLLSLGPGVTVPGGRGALLVRLGSDLGALRQWIARGLARLVVSGLAVAGGLIALLWSEPALGAALALALPIAAAPGLRTAGDLTRATRRLRRARGRFASLLADRLAAITTVTAFAHERGEARRLARSAARLHAAAIARADATGRLRATGETAALASSAVVTGAGALGIAHGAVSLGGLVAALLLAGLLAPRLRELARVLEYWNQARIAREKLEALQTLRPPRRRGRAELPDGDGDLAFVRVRHRRRLRRFDAEIRAGEKVAVVGDNGAGKTTLLLLTGGALLPDGGRIEIDGVAVGDLRPAARRRAFAFVGEPFPLLRGTVADNLRYGAGAVEDELLLDALARVGLEPSPALLARRLGECGAPLSAGERMRLALARAWLARPRILLSDETEAHLDPHGRALFAELLANWRGTALFVTHDPHLLRLADRVWQLEGGRLTADCPAEHFLASETGRALFGPRCEAGNARRAVA